MQLTTKKVIRQFLLVSTLMIAGLLLVHALGANVAMAQVLTPEDQPGNQASIGGTDGSLRAVVLRIVNFALGFLGLLALIMVIYGGFLYVSSAGNQENVDKAKKILMYAAIGIIVIAISYALVNTILGAAGTERQ